MKVLDLFSGIGGFSLGLERAGMETVAFCEIEEFPRKVLAKHWPNIYRHDDIHSLRYLYDGDEGVLVDAKAEHAICRGSIDLICGGFPCQPFSKAGKQGGKADDRDLWPEMFRVICEVQPTWVIGENVAGFISMELDRTLSDLENAGYACQTFDIPAVGVDAPHIRHRVWIVAHRCSAGRWQDAGSPHENEGESGAGDLANPTDGRWEKTDSKLHTKHYKAGKDRKSAIRRAYTGVQRTWAKWEPEPGVGRVANGIPRRVDRLKGLGNAVVPQIPEILGRAIMAAHND